MSLLEVTDLSVVYEPRGSEPTYAVKDATFSLERGEFVGLVGESGSGKSTIGFAITRLSKPPARISAGRILFDGTDIAGIEAEDLRRQRQGGFAMVLQSGMNALNPVRSIRNHFGDVFAAHGHVPRDKRLARARELVEKVELPVSVLDRYPGELSGGMRQRVSIALALSLEPQLMVFDEPTTALDVLVQHAVMNTIRELQRSENFTALLVSHDLGVVLESTSRVMVMHDGVIVAAGCSALITLMLSIAPDNRLRGMVFWLIGDLSATPSRWLPWLIWGAALMFAVRVARAINVMALHAEAAATLGISVARLRQGLFLCSALLTASAVSSAGSIGFVGLIVPHACRFAWGPDHRLLLPAATPTTSRMPRTGSSGVVELL